jgi:hypothetical protein
VAGKRAADVVKVATLLEALKLTDAGTSATPPAGVSVKVVALSVAGFMARLKVAVINLPLPATPDVLVVTNRLPLVGSDEVTVGMVTDAVAQTAPGMIEPAGTVATELLAVVPAVPRIAPPPPLPHPAMETASKIAVHHGSNLL